MSQSASDLLSQVSETLKASAPNVQERLKNLLVERELASRVDVLDKALSKAKEAKKELDKIRPDQVQIDTQGAKTETFSASAWESRKKAQEQLDKLNRAIEAALLGEAPDAFSKLRELVK